MPATQTTTLGRKWLLKMALFLIAGVVLAAWGIVDAAVWYPHRGARAASRLEFEYLSLLTDAGKRAASVSFEPVAEFDRLRLAARMGAVSDAERARYAWLEQLAIIGRLGPAPVQIPDAVARFNELKPAWQRADGTAKPVTALSWYDIYVQWIIAAAGGVLALGVAAQIARVRARRYGWEPAERRLHLPDGSTLVPADVAEFDKRRWDKFLIYLKIKPGHERHAGRELMLDLYHHTPLEEWVLEMERIAFPENSAKGAGGADPPAASA